MIFADALTINLMNFDDVRPHVLIFSPQLPRKVFEAVISLGSIRCHWVSSEHALAEVLREWGAKVEGLVVEGDRLIPNELLKLPRLKVVFSLSTGTDFYHHDQASRPFEIVTTAGVVSPAVADHALSLALVMLSRARPLEVVEGKWRRPSIQVRTFSSLSFGILGLGGVGGEIAKRIQGFSSKISYCNRRPRTDVSYDYCSSAEVLASQCDVLFVSCAGGASSYQLVNEGVLRALGSSGYLINVARGSVVDTRALQRALSAGTIAGAAVDVLENEPFVDSDLLKTPNLIVTPHIAWLDVESIAKLVESTRVSVSKYFDSSVRGPHA